MNSFPARQVLTHLALLDGIGPVTSTTLFERLGDDLATIYDFSQADFMEQFDFSASRAKLLHDGLADFGPLETELALLERHAISALTIADKEYPSLLRSIYAPPPVIFFKGSPLTAHGPSLALVGSRQANAYGKMVIDTFVPELVAHGLSIVSGGALGVDGIAHEACLSCKGSTVVVLGSGLLRPYPHAHKRLFENVCDQGGTLLSVFSQETNALPGNFPARNRIIAGLSWGCLVVQAASKSGALITARFAMDQGREVYAVPGRIDDPLSAGCHALLSQGATPVHTSSDIIRSLAHVPGLKVGELVATDPIKKMLSYKEELPTQPQTVQERIVQACGQGGGSFDELLTSTGLDFTALQEHLLQLEMSGTVRQTFMGTWQVER